MDTDDVDKALELLTNAVGNINKTISNLIQIAEILSDRVSKLEGGK